MKKIRNVVISFQDEIILALRYHIVYHFPFLKYSLDLKSLFFGHLVRVF